MTAFTFPPAVSLVSAYMLAGTGLTSVEFTPAIQSIGENAFSNCKGLTEVNIPDNITKIGVNGFSDCSALSVIRIPSTMSSIGGHSFFNCPAIREVYCAAAIPPTVTYPEGMSDEEKKKYSLTLFDSALLSDDSAATLYVPSGPYSLYASPKYPAWNFKKIMDLDN